MSDEEIFEDPTLADPDNQSSLSEDNSKYGWDEEFQRHIIALLLCDRQFMLQSMDLIKPNYFTNKAHQKAATIAFDFFKKHRVLPQKIFIAQEIKTSMKDNKALPYYLGEINGIYDYFQPGLDAREYLQDKITYFAKMQSLKQAFRSSLQEIEKSPESEETWTKIYETMRKAMTIDQNFDVGLNYFKTIKDRYAQMASDCIDKEVFPLGLETIDKSMKSGGYSRGEIISIVAGSGVGKSVMLACIAATNLLRGKKGVYISLELAEEKVADRMDSILTGVPVQNLYGNKNSVFEALSNLKGVDYEANMPFVVKQFPAGTATVNTIRAYISQLRFHGFDPDFIIIDYVGEMGDMPGMKTWESREKTVRDLRGLAVEEQVFIATAMQPNRSSKEVQKSASGRVDDEHLADSYGQIRPLDGCFSIMQTDSEKHLGIGRMYVIKQRDGVSRYQIYLSFNKENLRITECHKDTYMSKMNSHKETSAKDIQIDIEKVVKPYQVDDDEILPAVDNDEGEDEGVNAVVQK